MTSRFRIADDVAWVSQEDLDSGDAPTAYVTRVPKGLPIVLEGSGCVVWLALAVGGTIEEITDLAAEMAGLAPEAISHDVADLVDQLVTIRLVREE